MPVIEQEERHVSRHLKGTGVMFESPDIGYEYHSQEHSCHKHSPFPGKLI